MQPDLIDALIRILNRAFEREQGRWCAEIRKADGSPLEILVGDSEHRMSITTTADTLTSEIFRMSVKCWERTFNCESCIRR